MKGGLEGLKIGKCHPRCEYLRRTLAAVWEKRKSDGRSQFRGFY